MTFDIRDHIESLNHLGRGRYNCPVCTSKNFTINKKTGAYKCWANECDNAAIRQAIAPMGETGSDSAPKPKTAPKPKAKPVIIETIPTWRELSGDRQFPKRGKIKTPEWAMEKLQSKHCTQTTYLYGDSHSVRRCDANGEKEVRPFVEGRITKGDRQWDAYRLSEAIETSGEGYWCFAVEGEKTVEAMRYIHLPCITWQGGSWTEDDLSRTVVQLKTANVKGLIFIPDHDEPGQKKAAKVLEVCAKHSYPCLVLNPLDIWAEMPEKGDMADFVKYYHGEDLGEYFFDESLEIAIERAFDKQKPDPKPAPQPDPTEGDRPITVETTRPLSDPKPETKRIHGGYKDLKVAELFDFVANELSGRLAFDDLRSEIVLDNEPLTFGHDLKFWFFDKFGESAPKEDIYSCLLYHAKQKSFNPVAKYLEEVSAASARVDITNLASRYFGTEDPIYDRMVEMWLISAVARSMDPGCQVDHTLILQGSQGRGKSTWFNTLAGEWFSDSVKDIENKDSLLTMHSSWIIELAEINRITSKKQAATVKHFLTQKEDTFRKPYAKEVERNQRRSVFCGTVNPSRFLVDDENRRFWIIPVSDELKAIDIPMAERERDGIWAAAVDALLAGQPWYPTEEEKLAIAAINKEFVDADVWTEPIEEYCHNRPWVSVFEILYDLFKMSTAEMDRRSEMRVARILDQMGWGKQTRKEIYGKLRRVRLNPTWNESEARYYTDDANTNLFNNIVGKVGKVGTSIDTQSLGTDQPTDQPLLEVGRDGGWIDPTSDNEVGKSEPQSQSGIYQPTNLPIPLPEKYSRAGFEHPLGTVAYLKNTNKKLTIKGFPPLGGLFSARRYLCVDANGIEDWIRQSDLVVMDQ